MRPHLPDPPDTLLSRHRSFLFRYTSALIISAILFSLTPPTASARCLTDNCENGSKYTGEFMNGKQHGRGKMKQPGSAELEGDWLNGTLVTSSDHNTPAKGPASKTTTAEMVTGKTPPRKVTSLDTRPTSNNGLPALPEKPAPLLPANRDSRIVVSEMQVQKETKTYSASSEERMVIFVKDHLVNLRSGPGTETTVLARYAQGKPVRWMKREGSWVNVHDNKGRSGWVIEKSLTPDPPSGYLVVAENNATLHASPDTESKTVQVLPKGMPVLPTSSQGEWRQITLWNDETGWLLASQLTPTTP